MCLLYEMEQKEFETIVRNIRSHVLHVATRYTGNADDGEDVTQDVMLKLWCLRDKLDEYRSVEALAVVMAKNIALNRIRSALKLVGEDVREEISDNDNPEAVYINKEEEERVMELISQLPDAQQATLRMKHVDGMEVSEIASTIGSTENAVRVNLARARKKILSYFNLDDYE